jgi:rubrerythrin
MFCPKCGDELVKVGGELTCVRGRMGLSRHLERRLTECFISGADKPRELKLSFIVGGKWFCPGCGVATVEAGGVVRCPRCGLSLNEFVRALVELHPHARVAGEEEGYG